MLVPKKFLHYLLLVIVVVLTPFITKSAESATQHKGIMMYPDVYEDTVAFVYGGDIWIASTEGGVATRITMHDGSEAFPRFSPDGSQIAFVGSYDGNSDVYVMNRYGGDITRVTFHPGYDQVIDWVPSKDKILFSSSRNSHSRFNRLFLISPDGTGLEELPLPEASYGAFSPEGKQIVYNKVSRERRNWKRYRGGTAQELYLYNFETQESRQLTDFEGTDRLPMWIDDNIYYSSDRGWRLNLYRYNPATGENEQLTDHEEYDVRYPSNGQNKIVYQHGATLRLYDIVTEESREIPITIKTDLPERRPYTKDVKDFLTEYDVSPEGKRMVTVARGELFSVPREHGTTRDLTKTSDAREKDAVWSPDGKRIAYLSDATGEYEIYLTDPKGKSEPIKLTENSSGYRHALRWSPDGGKIAFTDQTLSLYILDVESKRITKVDKAHYENIDVSINRKPISDYAWSPDSRYIAYSMMDSSWTYQVYIYSLNTGEIHRVSDGLFNDFGPAFTRDGDHLLFISNRNFNPTFGDFEWEMVYKDVANIYAVTLKEDGEPLFPVQSDEVGETEDENADEPDEVRVEIEFEGLSERVEEFPLERGNYRSLETNESTVFYLNKDDGDFNKFEFRDVGPMNLYAFSLEDRKEETVIENIDSYKISADGDVIAYKKRHDVGIIDATARNSGGENLDLSDLTMHINPVEEWQQIFQEAWRMQRDFFYEPNMRGIDWPAMRDKYGDMLQFASRRQDVDYIIGEMISELSTSHTYVYGGDDTRDADRVNVGLLGVDWTVDQSADRYRFGKIYDTPNWTYDITPPLGKPHVNIREGEYLLEVNGTPVSAAKNIYTYFQNLAGQQVTLLVNDEPSTSGAREVTVQPDHSEYRIRHFAWLEHNRQMVEQMSDGKIGYLYFPDTYMGSAQIFPQYYYSQLDKEGLIIDGRYNGGGLDPDIFLRRLDHPVMSYWTRRYSHDQTAPSKVVRAHMVCLTNRQAGSGGDMLPQEFRQRGMGSVIGTRTWGGLVGLSMYIPMIDGGMLTAPDYRIYSVDGEWIVENEGVTPDITVDLTPKDMIDGRDPQLQKGVEVLMEKIKEDPITWPAHPPFPQQEMPE